ncbi:multicopper oxidase family protein [Pseudalkalibacillus sp. SCS-8]|uniref:multicopper oxidase family protein n=1 Tax=Pseudalkalibacillus nanhaiensis TaxID=3115291 RepID=UPI0032DA6E60
MNKKIIGSVLIVVLVALGFWVFYQSPFYSGGAQTLPNGVTEGGTSIMNIGTQQTGEREVKTFNLTAEQKEWEIDNGKTVKAWTYNGTVPGEALTVTEGDYVKVNLKNELDVPVTIHWHGVLLPNKMDGVPGLTQDAVQPGESFTYEFIADDAGTYWYHSHQHSSKQVDKGLYGAFIVEEKEKKYEKEKVFILDEWAIEDEKREMSNMPGMMMGGMDGDGEADTKQMYDTFTVNGKSGKQIEPLQLKDGETARLRFINAGFQQHRLVFPEGTMKVIENDAEAVVGSDGSAKVLEIAPGERIDVAFTMKGDKLVIGEDPDVENAEDLQIPVISDSNGSQVQKEKLNVSAGRSVADGTSFGSENLIFDKIPDADVTYDMNLNMGMEMGEGMQFQINEKVFPDTPPIEVEEGDVVKVKLKNTGHMNHPMHLHGHRFQVTSKNGQEFEQPIVKDLIHVKPGEEYIVYFKADNKGEWLFHCHDNNHAARGMVKIVDYKEVFSPFQIGGEHGNEPN